MRKTFLTNEDEKRFVKSINGLEPDDNGNVQIDTAGSGIPGAGTPGENGGYYTPEITQPEAGKMQIDWTASRDDMPAVEPRSVALPGGPPGDPGEDYVLTDTDKQEIAELAAGMVDVPGGGLETAAELQLAAGRIEAETAAKTTLDTGVTLGMLKSYRRFVFVLDGASNVALTNLYLKLDNAVIGRSDAQGGLVYVYEWLNAEKGLLRAAAIFQANPSMIDPVGSNYIVESLPKSWGNGMMGQTGTMIIDLSKQTDETTLKLYSMNSTTIGYDWEVRGLTV